MNCETTKFATMISAPMDAATIGLATMDTAKIHIEIWTPQQLT